MSLARDIMPMRARSLLVTADMRATNQLGMGVAIVLATLCVTSCGGGGGGGGNNAPGSPGSPGAPGSPTSPPVVNRAPVAANDVLRADGTALTAIGVLTNDTDPDGNPLTVTIEEAAPIGTAVVNTDNTVRIDSLPGGPGFKGVTRFRYRVTDGGGLSSVATAVVFVGTDPFRVLFAGDANANGSTEVYVADFIGPASAVTMATDGNLRLRGFVGSQNGATVVYRRADSATPPTTDLSFVSTATPATQVRISLPIGTTLVQDAQGEDQYGVSPDGQWIEFIARDGSNLQAAYVLNVSTPAAVAKVSIPGAAYVTLPRFSSNSKNLYLLVSPATNGANKSLYTAELGTSNVVPISAPNAVSSADDVLDYSVASDQSRVLIRANRGGREGLYFIDSSQLQTEALVSKPLGPLEALAESTVGLPPGLGGSPRTQRVAYTITSFNGLGVKIGFNTDVSEVSATPTPRSVASSLSPPTQVIGLRPDDGAVLFSRGAEVREAVVDSGTSDSLVSAGVSGWYDSTGNIVLVKQVLPAGNTQYTALAVALRGSFGSTLPLGTPAQAAAYFDVSGFDRAVVVLGEGATTGSAPSSARLALFNAVAPDKPIYLAEFQSPLQLTTSSSQVVSR
jgi:hypothetical protein